MANTGRYTLLTGQYQIRREGAGTQSRPDGDTVQFIVDDPAAVLALPRFSPRPPKISATNTVSLRLEVIDALETHFPTVGGPEVHQNLPLAEAARDFMLSSLGFKQLTFDARGSVVSANAFRLPGYVLASGIESNGRVVALLYPGKAPKPGGTHLRVTPADMRRSANLASLSRGMAYATHYQTQPHELMLASRAVAAKARSQGLGVFGAENVGLKKASSIKNLDSLQKLVMFPKLFRRLAAYFVETQGSLAGFEAWVRADPQRDDRLLLPSGEVGNLHDAFVVKSGRLKLTLNPEDITVLE